VSFTIDPPRRASQEFTATAIEGSRGTTSVVIAGGPTGIASSLADKSQLRTWHEQRKLALLCLRQIERMLSTTPESGDQAWRSVTCPWCGGSRMPQAIQDSCRWRAVAQLDAGGVVDSRHSLEHRYKEKGASFVRALKTTQERVRYDGPRPFRSASGIRDADRWRSNR
jgi:hypothetical protein